MDWLVGLSRIKRYVDTYLFIYLFIYLNIWLDNFMMIHNTVYEICIVFILYVGRVAQSV